MYLTHNIGSASALPIIGSASAASYNISPSLSHRMYLTHNIASASALPIICCTLSTHTMLNVRELAATGNRWNLAIRPPNVVQNDGYACRENGGYRVPAGYRVQHIIGSAEALPLLCVRFFRWERERERDTERERERETEVTSPLSH